MLAPLDQRCHVGKFVLVEDVVAGVQIKAVALKPARIDDYIANAPLFE